MVIFRTLLCLRVIELGDGEQRTCLLSKSRARRRPVMLCSRDFSRAHHRLHEYFGSSQTVIGKSFLRFAGFFWTFPLVPMFHRIVPNLVDVNFTRTMLARLRFLCSITPYNLRY